MAPYTTTRSTSFLADNAILQVTPTTNIITTILSQIAESIREARILRISRTIGYTRRIQGRRANHQKGMGIGTAAAETVASTRWR